MHAAALSTTTRTRRGQWLAPLGAYLVAFALLAARLLPSFASAVPAEPNLQDAHVLPWLLAWVAHALSTDPASLYHANVAWPAPNQLAGTDPLLAAQLPFAPLYAATGNAVLGANAVAWLAYPLAAFAMERLLRHAGVSALIAWIAGLAFALGTQRIPFNLNQLAIPNLLLPWLALALTRLRDVPTAPRAALLLLALATSVLASLYAAVLAALFCTVWGAFELLRARPRRTRFVAWALVVATIASALLLAAIQPYLGTLDARRGDFTTAQRFALPLGGPRDVALALLLVLGNYAQSVRLLPRPPLEVATLLAAALIALVALRRGFAVARRLAPRAVVLWLAFGTLAWGYPGPLAGLVAASPLASFRYLHRFAVLADFGLVLLLATALDALRAWLPPRVALAPALAVLALALWARGVPFAESPMHRVSALTPESRAAYAAAARIVAQDGGGALLELPIWGLLPGGEPKPQTLEPDMMLASTLHWWPTPAAHLSYHAPHRAFFMRAADGLPDPRALEELVDATHVRWLLLRPGAQWLDGASTRASVLDALARTPDVGGRWDVGDGFTLLRLDRAPRHPAWFATLRDGWTPGTSVLGSSLAPLADGAARATVSIDGALPERVAAGKVETVVRVRNDGTRTWPVVPPPAAPLTLDARWANPVKRQGTVMLSERWWQVGPSGEPAGAPVVERRTQLRRDLDPGEEVVLPVTLRTPDRPGAYVLELHVEQVDGARFAGDGNAPVRRRVTVAAAPAS